MPTGTGPSDITASRFPAGVPPDPGNADYHAVGASFPVSDRPAGDPLFSSQIGSAPDMTHEVNGTLPDAGGESPVERFSVEPVA